MLSAVRRGGWCSSAQGRASRHARANNSFNVVEIDLDTGAGEVQFYKYLPDYHRWQVNTDANPNNERGIFPEFTVERLARASGQANASSSSVGRGIGVTGKVK